MWRLVWLLAGVTAIPPHQETARVARFVAHMCEWGALATISTQDPPMRGQPFANVFSISDGPVGKSSGVPYMYLTDLEISVHDLKVNANASLTMSLAQTSYCKKHGYDPQDPLCAHVIFYGVVEKVQNGTEADFAKTALFSRHPEMAFWPKGHNWFFAKLNIINIWLLDFFGGIKTVTPEDYFNAVPYKTTLGILHPDAKTLERMRRKATKMIRGLEAKIYKERLLELGINVFLDVTEHLFFH